VAVDAVTVLGHCWPPGCRQRASATRQEAQWVLSGTGLTGPSVPVPVGAACYPLWNEPKGVPGVPAPVGAACLALLSNASVVSITSYGTTASG